jgi:ABC-2 type transport system ATP-binding protein
MNAEIIQFKKISKFYNGKEALKNLSFSIKEGKVFGYIGPNGAGKTTTIKIINSLITDYSGKLMINGLNIPERRYEISKILGYMPQVIAFQDWRTVEHVLKTFGLLSGLEKKALERRIGEVLELVGLGKEKKKKVIHLSGGMNQKLGLAQALLHSPRIIVLDEPLSGLDPGSRISLKQTIKNLRDKGITIFFSSHILSDVQDIADKVGVLHNGKLIITGTIEEIKSKYSIRDDIDISFSKFTGKSSDFDLISGIKRTEKKNDMDFRIILDSSMSYDELVHKIIKFFMGKGCRVKSIKPVTSSLDELFLKIIKEEEGA